MTGKDSTTGDRTTGEGGAVGEDSRTVGEGTRAVRAGLPDPVKYEPTLPGPVFAAHFHLPGEPAGPYTYGRDENPTWTHLERAISELEAPGRTVETLVFASGMAAISSVIFSQLRALRGRRPARRRLPGPAPAARTPGGVRHRGTDRPHRGRRPARRPRRGPPPVDRDALQPRTRRVRHPPNFVKEAHAAGALVAVDNTLATPLGQRPLELGADFSVASDTKGMTGHGDILLGHVTTANPELAAGVRRWRKVVGAIPGPMEAWLAHRSLATLQLRVDRQCATALTLAETLSTRDDVTALRYPGLPGDPSHPVASGQMRRYGSVVSFVLPDRDHAERFLDALRLVDDATSFGGVRSTAERRGRWGGDAVPEGFVRFSVGAEDPEDLVADVLRALDEAGRRTAP